MANKNLNKAKEAKKDEFYNPTPMFLICGEKNKCNNKNIFT